MNIGYVLKENTKCTYYPELLSLKTITDIIVHPVSSTQIQTDIFLEVSRSNDFFPPKYALCNRNTSNYQFLNSRTILFSIDTQGQGSQIHLEKTVCIFTLSKQLPHEIKACFPHVLFSFRELGEVSTRGILLLPADQCFS